MKFIAHLSDIHIRFTSRENEYRKVFKECYQTLKTQKPDRIVLTGDLFHTKINMSPISTSLGGEFLTELSKIAPVDIILGNHDMNERVLEQGNTVEPIVNLLENGFTLDKEVSPNNYFKNNLYGIYLFKYSGFYDIDSDLTYGIYSIWDKGVLSLKASDKKEGVSYVAMYHAPVYGCKMDNGMVNNSSKLLNTTNFDNFDIVMLGDIHKYQTFKRMEGEFSMAYPGSLIQQSFGESLDKGYLLWNIVEKTHKRILIENDNGFCKIKISNSKDLESEVLKKLQFSKNPENTKIYIEYEDREENFSMEKESNLINMIKEKFGCSSVEMSFMSNEKTKLNENKEESEEDFGNEFNEQLKIFLEEGGFDNIDDVLELSSEIEKTLNLKQIENFKWSLNKLEVDNLFSMPNKKTVFDFDKIQGLTGIIGENFSGKTNIIRSLVWVIWGKILGDGENKDAINIYSDSNEASGVCYITVNDSLYKIERAISKKYNESTKKTACTHSIDFTKLEHGDWKPVISDDKSTGKVEVNNLITDYFGTYEDFTKISLQVQNGEGDYLSLEQQPKNKLFSRYLNLLHFNDRYDEANETFKVIKKSQKLIGNPSDIEKIIQELNNSKEGYIEKLNDNKNVYQNQKNEIESIHKKIRDILSNKKEVSYSKYNNKQEILDLILNYGNSLNDLKLENAEIENWLKNNFKKSIDSELLNINPDKANQEIQRIKNNLIEKKKTFDNIKDWISNNSEKDELNDSEYFKKLADSKIELKEFENRLQIAHGKSCPTCGSVLKKEDPEAKIQLSENINSLNKDIETYQKLLEKSEEIKKHNKNYVNRKEEFSSLKVFLLDEKSKIEKLVNDIKIFNDSKDFIILNNLIDNKNEKASNNRTLISNIESELFKLRNELEIFENNIDKILYNKKIDEEIKEIENSLNFLQFKLDDIQYETDSLNKDIVLIESKILQEQSNLEQIKKAEKEYKKYSVYLQAVHRDGIPMKIIKSKLPVINNRINSIIKNIVNFKIELYITSKGDVKERFYFGESRENSLPLSMSSGSQYFISVLAIRDALHSVSHLTKPNLCVIDEGFGSLDDEKTIEIKGILDYLKTKYKNLIIITHRNEIKDFLDYEIYISRKELSGDAWHSEIST